MILLAMQGYNSAVVSSPMIYGIYLLDNGSVQAVEVVKVMILVISVIMALSSLRLVIHALRDIFASADRRNWEVTAIPHGVQNMKYEEVKRIVEGMTYKPGYTLQCFRNVDMSVIILCISHNTIDARNPELGVTGNITANRLINIQHEYQLTKESIIHEAWEMIKDYEIHEAKEWFKNGGQCVYDPHPELNKRSRNLPQA